MIAAARTTAVVVGIEAYSAGSGWSLNGPARDAVRMLRYLQRCGVPKERVRAYLTTLDENADARAAASDLAASVADPEKGTILKLFEQELLRENCDLLFIYWSGHGFLGIEEGRRLFTSDATLESASNIELDSLLGVLRTDKYPTIPRVDAVIDACANYVRFGTRGLTPGDFGGGTKGVAGREQYVLCAASAGEYAKNLGLEKSGLFSRELMGLIESGAAVWPLDVPALGDKLSERFADLRAGGGADQTPAVVLINAPNRAQRSDDLPAFYTAHQRFLDRLGVFKETFSFLACATVNDDLRTRDVREHIERLLASGVAAEVQGTPRRRYQLRRDATAEMAKRFAALDEAATIALKHARFFAEFMRVHEERLRSPNRRPSMSEIAIELPNVQSAAQWCLGSQNTDLAFAIAGATGWFWNMSARLEDGCTFLKSVLAATDGAPETADRAKTLYALGTLQFLEGDVASANRVLSDAADMWRRQPADAQANRDRGLGYALVVLGRATSTYEKACAAEKEAMTLFSVVNDKWGYALAANDLGYVHWLNGKYEDARDAYGESESCWRVLGDPWGLPLVLNNRGALASQPEGQGEAGGESPGPDYECAQRCHDEALRFHLDQNDVWGAAESLKYLGDLARLEGNALEADACYRESLEMHAKVGRRQLIADCLLGLAGIAVPASPVRRSDADVERARSAARMLAFVDAQHEVNKFFFTRQQEAELRDLKKRLQRILGGNRFDIAWADGRNATLEALIAAPPPQLPAAPAL